MVSEEEDDDEATEDGLITKRKRVTTCTSNANTAITSRSVRNSPSNITGRRAHSDREW